jgi:hypothetical protein
MKYLPCILLAILTIAFTSCNNDDDGVPAPDDFNALENSQVNFDFSGESYEVYGLGTVSVLDTFVNFTIEDSTGSVDYDTLYNQAMTFGVIEYRNDLTPRKFFTALIVNYDGPGIYSYFNHSGDAEDGGLWWIVYSQYTDENSVLEESIAGGFDYLYSDDEDYDGSIVITKDNNSVLEGTFSIDAYSDFGDTETVNTMAGSFSIEK